MAVPIHYLVLKGSIHEPTMVASLMYYPTDQEPSTADLVKYGLYQAALDAFKTEEAAENILGKTIVVVSYNGILLTYDLLNNLPSESRSALKAYLRKTPVPPVWKPLVLPSDDESSGAPLSQ